MTRHDIPVSADPADIIADLIGTPHVDGAAGPEAYDCWNLVRHVLRVLADRDLPLSDDMLGELQGEHWATRDIIAAIRSSDIHRSWPPVDRPRHLDIVILVQGMQQSHIGIWIDLPGLPVGILHASRAQGVVLESKAQVMGVYSRVSFHRSVEDGVAAVRRADVQLLPHVATAPLAIIVNDPLNPLSNAELIELREGASIHQAMADLPDARERWVILNDLPLLRRHPETGEDEYTRTVVAGDVVWILPPLPLGGDGRGSQVLASVLAIAASIAAPFLAGAILGQTVGALSLGGKLLSAGISIGANALISSFVPPPPSVAPLAAPDPTYSFGRFGNQMRPGARVPRPYGTLKREPDLVAAPWAEFEDNQQLVHVLLNLGSGDHDLLEFGIDDTPVWTVEGGYTGAIADVSHEALKPGEAVTLFPTGIEVSPEVEGLELQEPDEQIGQLTAGPFAAVSSGRTASELILDFVFPGGLFDVDGGRTETSVRWTIVAQEIDDNGAPVGPPFVLGAPNFTARNKNQIRLTRRYPVPVGRYQVSAVRTSPSTIDGPGAQDTLLWSALKAKLTTDADYDRDSILAIRVRADATSTRSLTSWYVRTTAVLPHFNAETGDIETGPTEQIDAAVLDIATSPFGLNLPEARIDIDQLRALARVWAARGDVCCTVFESDIDAFEALEMVLTAGRAKPIFAGSTLTFQRDQASRPTRLVTHADMIRGSFEVERAHFKRESPSVVRMRYRDREGRMRSLLCPYEPNATDIAEVITQVMVDPDQIWREGNYMAASNRLRRTFVSWIGLAGAQMYLPGETIRLSHPRPKYGQAARVLRRDGLVLTLSADVDFGDDDSGWLSLARPDGSFWGPVLVLPSTAANEVLVDADDFALILSGDGDGAYDLDFRVWLVSEDEAEPRAGATQVLEDRQSEATRAIVGRPGMRELTCMVVSSIPSGDGRVEVLAAVDDLEVHTADQAPLPAIIDPDGGLTNTAAPEWEGVSIVGQEVSLGVYDFTIAGPTIAGAASYLAERAVVSNNPDWTPAGSASTPLIEGPLGVAEDVLIRVAVVGAVLQGPWIVYRATLSTAVNGVVSATKEA